jgi:hypothetical protein
MRTDKKLWRNRKAKKELARRLQSDNPGLDVVHAHAAGIDVGNSAHYVAVRPDRDPQPVRRFECFTADLHRLAAWLQNCGVQTVALPSTGVYWIPLYDILEERGFAVYLVNARHTKNLPGRKSDVQESQWLLKLHSYGLLNNSFQPPSRIRVLRTYWRQRLQHVTGAATCVQRMQKARTQMNIQLANVISDLSGVTGQMIVRAIVGGERDPRKLPELTHPRIQASRGDMAQSRSFWRVALPDTAHPRPYPRFDPCIRCHQEGNQAAFGAQALALARFFFSHPYVPPPPKGMTASVLDALATMTRPPSSSTDTSASTNTRFLPVRKTPARQIKTVPEAGRRNETLFSTVITSLSSGTVEAAAPPQV